MEKFKQPLLTERTQIFISDRHVMALDAKNEIPQGYRQAVVNEVAFRYVHDEKFRESISDYFVWVNQKGLEGIDFHEVHVDGALTKINADKYLYLPAYRRAVLRRGNGFVAVTSNIDPHEGKLVLNAIPEAISMARVAYVKEDPLKPLVKRPVNAVSLEKQLISQYRQQGRSSDI